MTSNEKLIKKFEYDCFSNGLSQRRVDKYNLYLPKLSEKLGIQFDKAKEEDIRKLVAGIEQNPKYAAWTKYDLKVIIKRFYKWLNGDEEYPKTVRWIKPGTSLKNVNGILPEDILSPEDITKMINATINIRNNAIVSVLYESGFRVSEHENKARFLW